MAMDIPKGKAISMAIKVIRKVPDNRGRMPKWASSNNGVHWVSVRNSQMETLEKKPMESFNRTNNIPKVVMTLTVAHSIKRTSMNRSLNILCFRLISQLLLRVGINQHRHYYVPPSMTRSVGSQTFEEPIGRFLWKGEHNPLLLPSPRFQSGRSG